MSHIASSKHTVAEGLTTCKVIIVDFREIVVIGCHCCLIIDWLFIVLSHHVIFQSCRHTLILCRVSWCFDVGWC